MHEVFFSPLLDSRWLRQQPEGNYPARSLHHGVQEKRSHFSLHYCYKATRLNNWWKTCVSYFPLFPCRPSCICEFCILHKLDSIWIMLITSWGGNKIGSIIEDASAWPQLTVIWQLWRREKWSQKASENVCVTATKQRNQASGEIILQFISN